MYERRIIRSSKDSELGRGTRCPSADDDGLVEVEDQLSVFGELRLGEAVCLADADAEVGAETGGADIAGRFVVERAYRKCFVHHEAGRLDCDLPRLPIKEEPYTLGFAEALVEVGVQMYSTAPSNGRVHSLAWRLDRTACKFFPFQIYDDRHTRNLNSAQDERCID